MSSTASSYSSAEGTSPKLAVKTCDGRVKFSDDSFGLKKQGDSVSWTVDNFDAASDMIELENSSNDGWLANLSMEMCDDSGANCEAVPVEETYEK